MEVDAVLTLIDKNSDYLDELYKEFNVLLSEVSLPARPFPACAQVVHQLIIPPPALFGVGNASLPLPVLSSSSPSLSDCNRKTKRPS